jgi:hypothetical protein
MIKSGHWLKTQFLERDASLFQSGQSLGNRFLGILFMATWKFYQKRFWRGSQSLVIIHNVQETSKKLFLDRDAPSFQSFWVCLKNTTWKTDVRLGRRRPCKHKSVLRMEIERFWKILQAFEFVKLQKNLAFLNWCRPKIRH